MKRQRATSKHLSESHQALLNELVDVLSTFAASLTDAQLVILIMLYGQAEEDEFPGTYIWQQVARTELECRRMADGRRRRRQ